jgi:hypothetical protein
MTETAEAIRDMNPPQICKALLSRARGGVIPMSEFLSECAFWAVKDGFADLRPLPYPTKPQDVFEYEQMTFERRLALNHQFYLDHPAVNAYYDQYQMVKNHNASNLEWLIKVKNYLPKEDNITRDKVEARIKQFEGGDELTDTIKQTFSAEER